MLLHENASQASFYFCRCVLKEGCWWQILVCDGYFKWPGSTHISGGRVGLGTFLVVTAWEVVAKSLLLSGGLLEARVAARHLSVNRPVPTTKDCVKSAGLADPGLHPCRWWVPPFFLMVPIWLFEKWYLILLRMSSGERSYFYFLVYVLFKFVIMSMYYFVFFTK